MILLTWYLTAYLKYGKKLIKYCEQAPVYVYYIMKALNWVRWPFKGTIASYPARMEDTAKDVIFLKLKMSQILSLFLVRYNCMRFTLLLSALVNGCGLQKILDQCIFECKVSLG